MERPIILHDLPQSYAYAIAWTIARVVNFPRWELISPKAAGRLVDIAGYNGKNFTNINFFVVIKHHLNNDRIPRNTSGQNHHQVVENSDRRLILIVKRQRMKIRYALFCRFFGYQHTEHE